MHYMLYVYIVCIWGVVYKQMVKAKKQLYPKSGNKIQQNKAVLRIVVQYVQVHTYM